jgi:hypothetical protein
MSENLNKMTWLQYALAVEQSYGSRAFCKIPAAELIYILKERDELLEILAREGISLGENSVDPRSDEERQQDELADDERLTKEINRP